MRDDGNHDDEIVTGRLLQPMPWGTLRRILWAPGILYLINGIVAVPLLVQLGDRVRDATLAVVAMAVATTIGLAGVAAAAFFADRVRRYAQPAVLGAVLVAGGLTSLYLVAFGPSVGVSFAVYSQPAIYAFILLRRPWAIAVTAMFSAMTALLLALQDGWVAPLGQWLVISGVMASIAVTVGSLTARVIATASAEQRARSELATLNATLQQRVQAQVAELEQANQLKRFLSPQVADAVLAGDRDDVLGAHRRKVAVFFCDLRGFTSFTSSVEPEDVIDVLGEYYRAVGEVLHDYEATVGSFAGDGIFAFLNDPAPCDDPAAAAVAMAAEIRERMRPLITRWRELGYDLGMGIGVAAGHATLGLVGYEGRQDYTALGTVVNLAARLCGAARDGQILIDLRTANELPDGVTSEQVEGVALKGFPAEMRVLAVG